MKKIRIILADDHKIFLDGLVSLLSDNEELDVVATASSGEELIELVKHKECDLIISDISMKGISGIEATKIIMENNLNLKVLVLSMHISEEFVLNSIKAGADGFLPKDTSSTELIHAIKSIFNGERYFSKDISEFMFKNYITRYKNEQKIIEQGELTHREIEILKLSAIGLTNKEISEKLFISSKTVEAHKNHIMHKLKLKNSAELVIYAIKNKLIEL